MNSILPRQNGSSDTSRLPSPALWSRCPWEDIVNPNSGVDGVAFYDDFQDLPLQGTLTTQIAAGRYKVFGDTGNTITRVMSINSAIVSGGALQFELDTDNDEVAMAQSYPSYSMTGLPATDGKLWFEICYAQNSVATNMASVFLGLANVAAVTLSTTVPLNDGNAIDASMYGIGFRIEEDGLGVIDTVYTDGATSFTNVGDTEGGTLTAYTFKKLGMFYDPNDSAKCIRFFADNVELTSAVSRSTLTGLTNLDAAGLGLLMAFCADSGGTSFDGYVKWVRIAQLAPT